VIRTRDLVFLLQNADAAVAMPVATRSHPSDHYVRGCLNVIPCARGAPLPPSLLGRCAG
jgi:hypothetical protein